MTALAVCPWNKFARAATEIRYAARAETDNPPLAELLHSMMPHSVCALRARRSNGRDVTASFAILSSPRATPGDYSLLPHVEPLLGRSLPARPSDGDMGSSTACNAPSWRLCESATNARARPRGRRRMDCDDRGTRSMSRLFCFGLGYCAAELGRRLLPQGWTVAGTTAHARENARALADRASNHFCSRVIRAPRCRRRRQSATHVLLSIPPDAKGDPALASTATRSPGAHRSAGSDISRLSVSTATQRRMGRRDHGTKARNRTGQRRLKAENGWIDLARRSGKTLVIYRLPGIYGPGRSAIDQLKAGTARRIFKPGQLTNRAHVDDIATAVEASMDLAPGVHIFNVVDDLPAPPQDVIAYGAELLGVPCPPATDPADADSVANGAKLLHREQESLERPYEGRTWCEARLSNLCRGVESHRRPFADSFLVARHTFSAIPPE